MQFNFHLDVYDMNVCVSIGETDEDYRAWISELLDGTNVTFDEEGYRLPGSGRCFIDSHANIYIRLKQLDCEVREMSTLAHEIFHGAELLLERLGMSLTPSSSEAYAYLIDFLTNRIVKEIWTERKKESSKSEILS